MKHRKNSGINLILSAALFIIISAASCYLILILPLSRQPGLIFRNTLYVFPLIFITTLVFGITDNPFLRAFTASVMFAFVLFPYSGLLNSGLSDQYALGGIIPWSDAFTMQLNTQRFLYGTQMGQSTAIRPISTVFYAVFLHLTGNNYLALQIFLCISIALCMISAADSVNHTFGTACGAMFFTLLYYYIRQRLGTFMTEPYGFICGLLSCIWLLNGIRLKKQGMIFCGFIILSVGLNARPAAMFIFPAAGLWYHFVFMKNQTKKILWSGLMLIAMLSGFALNRITQTYVYGPEKIPNRQAAEMVYGLCLGGKSWGDVVGTEEMTSLNNSDNVIRDVAALCVPVIREHPENILLALKTIFIDSLIKSEYYGAFSFVNGNPKLLQSVFRYILMGIWLIGFLLIVKNRRQAHYSFLLSCTAGILLSECAAVPFSTNYLRLYAVSMWIPACITGLPLQYIIKRYFSKNSLSAEMQPVDITVFINASAYSALISITTIFGALYISKYPLKFPSIKPGNCKNDEKMLLTSVDQGSFIYLDEKENLDAEHYPYFRLPYVRQHFHDTASVEMFPFTDSIDTPTAIIRGIDLTDHGDALIFSPLALVEGRTGYAQFCGYFIDPPVLRNDRFFIPTSVTFYEDEL